MSKLVIKDLNDSKELDREAMRSITGGSYQGTRHLSGQASHFLRTPQPQAGLGDLFGFRIDNRIEP
jgi:hypothetical protein